MTDTPRVPPGYEWPTFTREHDGETLVFSVHLMRCDAEGVFMFLAYRNLDHDTELDLLRKGCDQTESRPMPLIDGGVPEHALAHIAQQFHEHPEVGIVFGPANAEDASSN